MQWLFGQNSAMFLATLLTALAVLLFSVYRWRKKTFSLFKELGIPGPEPNLILGNLIPIWREGLGPACSRWVKEYGDIVGYYNGMMPGIVTRDFELMKRIFINDFPYFTGRQTIAAVSNNIAVNEVRLTRVAGDDWRHLKNIVLPAFKTSNIRKAFPVAHECAEECLRALDSKMAGSDGCVELFQPFCNMASDFGLQVFTGARTEIQRGNAAALAISRAARRSVGQFGAIKFLLLNILPNIPWMHKILFSLRSLFVQLPSDELMDRMLPIINHRRAHPEPNREDVLQLLLNYEKEEGQNKGKARGLELSATLTSHPLDLVTNSNTCIFLTAGIDTAASPLAFTSYLLSEHPEIQDKVRAEIQAVLDKEGKFTYDNLSELTYLGQVLSESLRLYPSLPGSIRRNCDKDYDYNGIRIPKGMNIYVPTLDIHRDPVLWPEPNKFDPERFNKTNKENIHPMSYFPFGIGPRKCIASMLSQMEITVTLALLVARYKLLPSGKYKDEPPIYAAATLLGYPKEGIWVKLQKL